MEKYYTPKIEEFHVGFEYELLYKLENDFWRKEKFHSKTLFWSEIEDYLFKKQIRIKYLDKEDIESLGFKEISSGWYHQYPNMNKKGYQILYKLGEEFSLSYGIHEHSKNIFTGKIKNKSELIRLLNQLEIS